MRLRSSSNVYNQSLVGSMIQALGEEQAETWCRGLVDNFARKPQGGDRDQLRAIAAGEVPRDPEMFRHYVHAFVKLQRGHQAMENRVVLPAAFERLTPEDLAELARRMATRRGLLFAG